jgi:sortase A
MDKVILMAKKYWPYLLTLVIICSAVLGISALGKRNHWTNAKDKISLTITKPPIKNTNFTIDIEKVHVSAPIITGIDPSNEKVYDAALTKGVLLMTGTGEIGKTGNAVIYGHSSANEVSPYQKIFATINNLKNGDIIKVHKDDTSYTYAVTNKKVVEATDLSILDQTKDKTLTLMTCWPIGTDKQRLIIVAKQQ